jgi:hypothetical protein
MADGFLDVLAAAVMRRGIMSIEAEVAWHDELDAALAEPGSGAPVTGSLRGGGTYEVARAQQNALGIASTDAGEPAAGKEPAQRPASGD